MKTYVKSIAVALAILLTGCGVKTEDHQKVVSELTQAKQELQAARDQASSLKVEVADANSKISRLTSELKAATENVTGLTSEIDRLKKQDAYAFSEAGKLLDSGDTSGALRAYQTFIRDFPDSTRISSANSQIQLISQRLESQRRAEAARAESERQESARLEVQRKLRSGELTLAEWERVLRGKTMQQVIELIGRPNNNIRENTLWGYHNMVYDPILGRRRSLQVNFGYSATVVSVEYY